MTFSTLDGHAVRLTDYRGKVVVLNFWGVWCGPCVREMPELADFARHAATGSAVFAVNSEIGGETPADTARFLHVHAFEVPVVLDHDRAAYRSFHIEGLPTTLLIDPQGIVRVRRMGFAATAGYEGWLVREVRALR